MGRWLRRNGGAVLRVTIAVVWSALGVTGTIASWVPADWSQVTPFVIAGVPTALLIYSEYRHLSGRPDVRFGAPVRGLGQIWFRSRLPEGVRRIFPNTMHVPVVWRLPIENHGSTAEVQVQLVHVEPDVITSYHPLHIEGDDPADGLSYQRGFKLVRGQTELVNVVAMTRARGHRAAFFVCTTKTNDAVLQVDVDGTLTFSVRAFVDGDVPIDHTYRVEVNREAGTLEMTSL